MLLCVKKLLHQKVICFTCSYNILKLSFSEYYLRISGKSVQRSLAYMDLDQLKTNIFFQDIFVVHVESSRVDHEEDLKSDYYEYLK